MIISRQTLRLIQDYSKTDQDHEKTAFRLLQECLKSPLRYLQDHLKTTSRQPNSTQLFQILIPWTGSLKSTFRQYKDQVITIQDFFMTI